MKLLAAIALAVSLAMPAHAEPHWRLYVLFSTPDEPEPHQEYEPRPVNSLSECLSRAGSVQSYLAERIPHDVRVTALCVQFDVTGYDEALDAFRRTIGVMG